MRKLFLICAVLVASVAQADLIFWQVNWEDFTEIGADTAYLYLNGSKIGTATDVPDYPQSSKFAYGSANDTFVIELYNMKGGNPGEVVAYSEYVTYQELYNKFIFDNQISAPPGYWTGGKYSVPEPTGGLLLLLGAGLLALRRRNAPAA